MFDAPIGTRHWRHFFIGTGSQYGDAHAKGMMMMMMMVMMMMMMIQRDDSTWWFNVMIQHDDWTWWLNITVAQAYDYFVAAIHTHKKPLQTLIGHEDPMVWRILIDFDTRYATGRLAHQIFLRRSDLNGLLVDSPPGIGHWASTSRSHFLMIWWLMENSSCNLLAACHLAEGAPRKSLSQPITAARWTSGGFSCAHRAGLWWHPAAATGCAGTKLWPFEGATCCHRSTERSVGIVRLGRWIKRRSASE